MALALLLAAAPVATGQSAQEPPPAPAAGAAAEASGPPGATEGATPLPGPGQRRELLIRLANTYRAAGRYRKAAEQYRELIALEPDAVEFRLGLAESLLLAGEHAEAVAEFEQVLAREPDNVAALIGMGRSHAWAGESVRAARSFERALELDPDSVPARLELMRLDLARSHYARALRYAEQLAALAPRNPAEQAAADEASAARARIELLTRAQGWLRASAYSNRDRFRRVNVGGELRLYPWLALPLTLSFVHAEFRQGGGHLTRETVQAAVGYAIERNLRFDGHLRYSRYGDRDETTGWRLAAVFEPLDRLQLRGSWRRRDLVDGAGGTDRGLEAVEMLSHGGASLAAVARKLEEEELAFAVEQYLWRPLLTYLQLVRAQVDGGNRHEDLSAGAGLDVWRLAGLPEPNSHALRVKYGYWGTRYRLQEPSYFSPRQFWVQTVSVEYELQLRRPPHQVRLVLEPALQRLKGEAELAFAGYGGLWWQIGDRLAFELQGWYFEQPLPFRSATVTAAFGYRF